MRLRLPVAALALAAVAAPTAHAAFRLPERQTPVRGNPAHRLVNVGIDPMQYDRATGCKPRPKPGAVAFARWLQRNVRGQYWGTYRCERWGKGSASLHAENRAIDWQLNVHDPGDKRAAKAVIRLLLAPDTMGNPHALARRMGVQEIIWDCSYWGAGMAQFTRYSACFNKHGQERRRVGATIAHRDHIHFGLSKAGAAGRTTFWRQRG